LFSIFITRVENEKPKFMKRKIIQSLLTVFLLLAGSLSASGQAKKDYQGKWNFEAPSAPEGYLHGTFEIKKDSVFTTFIDYSERFPSNWIKATKDSLYFQAYINGTDVLFSLKTDDKNKISGKAVWSDGETQLMLTKK
jgi:hypothetical protein